MVALSLWNVVCCRDFCYSNGWQPCHYERQSIVKIFVTIIDCSLLIMKGSLLSRFQLLQWMVAFIMEGSLFSGFLLLQWMVALSLQKVVYCRDFCHYNGWQPCHYGRQSVVEIFVTIIDRSLVIMEGSLLSRFLLVQWMVPLSLWKVVYRSDINHFNGWQPCHYGMLSILDIFVIPLDGSLVIM